MEEKQFFNRKALSEAGTSYSVGIVAYVVVSLIFQIVAMLYLGEAYGDDPAVQFLSFLLPQICFAAAALIFFRRSKVPVRTVYCGGKAKYFVLALLLQFGLLFSLSELNTLFLDWLSSLGYENPPSALPPLSGWNLLLAILIIALLPALFEETLFRGILVGRMQASGWGNVAAVCISGALFALYHGSPAQTIYQFFCGASFALLALRAGSVLPTAVAHLCNNAVILILTSTGYEVEGGWTMPQAWRIGLCVAAAVVLVGVLVYLIFFDKSGAQKGGVKDGKRFFLGAGVGIAVCAVLWISNLVTGFVGTGVAGG